MYQFFLLNNKMTHKHHHEHECYGGIIDFIEDFVECLIMAEEVLAHYFCPYCRKESVHRLFRENPDGAYDEVGLQCHNCKKIF